MRLVTSNVNDISNKIDMALRNQGRTLKECCVAFNSAYAKEIKDGKMKSLNKDFVSRVRRGGFKVVSVRISKLCEFLKVPLDEVKEYSPVYAQQAMLVRQLREFDAEIKSDSTFKKRFSCLHPLLLGLQQSLQGKVKQDE